jgi:hypothetical protein
MEQINPNTKNFDRLQDEGFIETKVRKVVHQFEIFEINRTFSANITVHPWPYGVVTKDGYYDNCLSYYFGLSIKRRKGE